MAEIYLIRHGQTQWALESKYRGRADAEINDQGRREAACVGEALKDVPLRRIFASPLSRTTETAEVIAADRDIKIIPDPGFLDIDYGEWTGRTDDDVREEFGELRALWETEPHAVTFPGGECLADVRRRAVARLRTLGVVFAGEPLAIVTHRVVIKTLIAAVKGLDDSHFWRIPIDTCAMTVLSAEWGVLKVVQENVADHLAGLDGHDATDF